MSANDEHYCIVAIIAVILPTIVVGVFAYFLYLSEGAERERR
jgi:uncharacterized membrane protein